MESAPFPTDERRRKETIDALRILDSPRENFSDAVAMAAAAVADTPISAVTVVDSDRQWFKASCGLALTETGRDVSFCAHTIGNDRRPLVVDDARLDPRFADNPFVTGPPYLRFYAGFPLLVADRSIGALCVIDDRPRTLTAEQMARLTTLAQGVAAWMAAGRGADGP